MRKSVLLLIAVCAFLIAVIPSSAQIVNGGFETGNFYGWTYSGCAAVSSTYHHTGDYSAALGIDVDIVPGYPPNLLSAADIYQYVDLSGVSNVTFYIYTPNPYVGLEVYINGTEVFSTTSTYSTWTKITINVSSWSGVSKLEFESTTTDTVPTSSGTYYLYIDDVALQYEILTIPKINTTQITIGKAVKTSLFGSVTVTVSDSVNHTGRWLYIPLGFVQGEVGDGHYVFFLQENNSTPIHVTPEQTVYEGVQFYKLWIPHFSTNTVIIQSWHGAYNLTVHDAQPNSSYGMYVDEGIDGVQVRFIGAAIHLPTFDNSGGGNWDKFALFAFSEPINTSAQYDIVINQSTWRLYNSTGGLKYEGSNEQFWGYVNSSWLTDLRVFSNTGELKYWVIYPHATNTTPVRLTCSMRSGSQVLEIGHVISPNAYLYVTVGSGHGTPVEVYLNGHEVGTFNAKVGVHKLTVPSIYLNEGENNVTYTSTKCGQVLITKTELIYCSNNTCTDIWVDVPKGSKYIAVAYDNPLARTSKYEQVFNVYSNDPAEVVGFFVNETVFPSISVNGNEVSYTAGLKCGEISPPISVNYTYFKCGPNSMVFHSLIGSADILLTAYYKDSVSIDLYRNGGFMRIYANYTPALDNESPFNVSFGVRMTVYEMNVQMNGSAYDNYTFNWPVLSLNIPNAVAGEEYPFYLAILYNNPPDPNISMIGAFSTYNATCTIYHYLVGKPLHFELLYHDPEGNALTSVKWDFGDGATSTLLNPTHTYTHLGYYDVTVYATDNGYIEHLTGSKTVTLLISGNKLAHHYIHTIIITNNYISIDGHETHTSGSIAVIRSKSIQIGSTVIPVCINNLTAESAHALAKVMNYMPINDSITIVKSLENSSIWDAMNVTYSPYLSSAVRNEIIQELGI